jgi:hypothetical protein
MPPAPTSIGADARSFLRENASLMWWLGVALVLCYGYAATSFTLSIDDELYLIADTRLDWISNGRYGDTLVKYLLDDGMPLPFMHAALAAGLIGVAALAWSFAFDRASDGRLSRSPLLVLFCVFYATLPMNAFYMTFNIYNVDVGIGSVAAALGCLYSWVWAFETRSKGSFIATFALISLALSIYQSFSIVVPTSLLILYALHLAHGGETAGKPRLPFRLLAPFLLAFVVFTAISQSVPRSDYLDTFVGWGKHDVATITGQLTYYVKSVLTGAPFGGLQPVTVIAVVGLVVLLLALTRPPSLRSLLLTLAILAILLAPFAMSVLLGSPVPNRAQQVLPLAYASLVLFLPVQSPVIQRYAWAIYAVSALFIVWHAQSITRLFFSEQLAYESDVALDQAVMERLAADGWEGQPIAFVVVGTADLRPLNRYFMKEETFGGSFFVWDGGARAVPFMQVMGENVRWPSDEERRAAETAARDMPVWPSKGSVRFINGTGILKLSNADPGPAGAK